MILLLIFSFAPSAIYVIGAILNFIIRYDFYEFRRSPGDMVIECSAISMWYTVVVSVLPHAFNGFVPIYGIFAISSSIFMFGARLFLGEARWSVTATVLVHALLFMIMCSTSAEVAMLLYSMPT